MSIIKIDASNTISAIPIAHIQIVSFEKETKCIKIVTNAITTSFNDEEKVFKSIVKDIDSYYNKPSFIKRIKESFKPPVQFIKDMIYFLKMEIPDIHKEKDLIKKDFKAWKEGK
jgi:hypothetical protein